LKKLCTHCGRPLTLEGGVEICLVCNELIIADDAAVSKVVIECPGATLYDVETGAVLQGVKWHDPENVALGFEIVGTPIFAPKHAVRRVIEAENIGKITRCRACQDYTVRMRAQQRDHKVQGPSAARRRAENLFKK
jgi:formylmethanofuran dehydrogenase subunit E